MNKRKAKRLALALAVASAMSTDGFSPAVNHRAASSQSRSARLPNTLNQGGRTGFGGDTPTFLPPSHATVSSTRQQLLPTRNSHYLGAAAAKMLTNPAATALTALSFPVTIASSAAPVISDNTDLADTLLKASSSAMMASGSALDPLFEAEVLTDVSHIALDLVTFLGPARLGIRVATIVGRVLAMAADYLPDHKMLPEELVFQVFMLTIAWIGLFKTALPMTMAHLNSNVTVRDGKAFQVLFGPTGMTWQQFKAMTAVCMDWVTVGPNEVICDSGSDYVYWLYKGEIVAQDETKQSTLFNITRRADCPASFKQDVGKGLFGEEHLIDDVEKFGSRKKKPKVQTTTDVPRNETHTVRAGPSGATLLRIHRPNLKVLMKSDEELTESIRTLVLYGMRDKLKAATGLNADK